MNEREELSRLTENMEKKGIIERSNSMWLNPVVLIKKRDISYRFTVDFRRLNDLVDPDGFEIPRITHY